MCTDVLFSHARKIKVEGKCGVCVNMSSVCSFQGKGEREVVLFGKR